MWVHEGRATEHMRVQRIMGLWVVLHHEERTRHATCESQHTLKIDDVEGVREASQRL